MLVQLVLTPQQQLEQAGQVWGGVKLQHCGIQFTGHLCRHNATSVRTILHLYHQTLAFPHIAHPPPVMQQDHISYNNTSPYHQTLAQPHLGHWPPVMQQDYISYNNTSPITWNTCTATFRSLATCDVTRPHQLQQYITHNMEHLHSHI